VLALNNPTIVVITDRNDLDDQLFDTFAACKQLLRQKPRQVENRQQLKELLRVASGGVIFTTIQKFQPEAGNVYEELSDRRNIVVIADEAHRTQYGFSAKTVDDKNADGIKKPDISILFEDYLAEFRDYQHTSVMPWHADKESFCSIPMFAVLLPQRVLSCP
jgi:type I site-specific restriction-modification system R (restriction) subunit